MAQPRQVSQVPAGQNARPAEIALPSPCPASQPFPARGLRAVVFDFDGTLAHTRIDFAQMRVRSLDHIRRAGLWTDAVAAAPYVLEAIERAAENLPPDQRRRFLTAANAILEDIEVEACTTGQPFDGVPEALVALERAHLQVAVITRNCRRAVDAFLRRHPMPISVLLTRDDVPRVKPHPDHLLHALERLQVAPGEALMVGDHRTDVQCGIAAGVAACGVLTAGTPADELREAGACLVAPNVPDVVDIVLRGIPGGRNA